ncbi:MAG: SDR family oxidoreductase [Mycobacteriales bacterium]
MTRHDSFRLDGRVALVTGGGSGLGRGMALALAAAGAHVVVASRNREQLDETVQLVEAGGATASARVLDVADPLAPAGLVDDIVADRQRIDVVVHAAGNQIRRPALEMTADEWDSLQAVHLRGAFLLAQAAGARMVEQRSGSIVFVGSMTSERLGMPNIAAYAAAKSGLLGLTRTLAVEWASAGVRVNTIAVGFFRTAMTKSVDNDPSRLALTNRVPMGRLGTADDMGGPVVFLASDASAYITGQCISVDGGWTVA